MITIAGCGAAAIALVAGARTGGPPPGRSTSVSSSSRTRASRRRSSECSCASAGSATSINGDAKSAVARAEAGLAIVRLHPEARDAWPEGCSARGTSPTAKRADGDVDAAVALFTECAEMARRSRSPRRGDGRVQHVGGDLGGARGSRRSPPVLGTRASMSARDRRGQRGHLHGSMPLNLLAIARVTAKQGELATASKLLREALPIAHEIRDEATARQIAELLAQTSRVEPTQSATLRPEGGVWHIAFNGTSVHVPDMKGLWHLRELVSRPRAPVLALSLIAAPTEDPVPVGDAGPMLDREALRQYRKRLADLDEELDDAEARHDVDATREAQHRARGAPQGARAGDGPRRQAAADRLANGEGAPQRDANDPPRHHLSLDRASGARGAPGRVGRDRRLVLLRAAHQHRLDDLTRLVRSERTAADEETNASLVEANFTGGRVPLLARETSK